MGQGLLKLGLGRSGPTVQGELVAGCRAHPEMSPRDAGGGGRGARALQPLQREPGPRTA